MMEFTRWFIFIRIRLQAAKKFKKIVIKKIVIKKIVMIEKYCGNGNILW